MKLMGYSIAFFRQIILESGHWAFLADVTYMAWLEYGGDDANFVNANIYWAHFMLMLLKIEI